jgi:hypothetical protein
MLVRTSIRLIARSFSAGLKSPACFCDTTSGLIRVVKRYTTNCGPIAEVETFEQVGLAHDDAEEIADLLNTLDALQRATPQH